MPVREGDFSFAASPSLTAYIFGPSSAQMLLRTVTRAEGASSAPLGPQNGLGVRKRRLASWPNHEAHARLFVVADGDPRLARLTIPTG
mmetsp:Transcript_28560/g.87420  ORF Transcript_28560/g.87420 Transcript_28560/m.87420 type:complete len:88 (-) Transcript_28560:1062-1325(-)